MDFTRSPTNGPFVRAIPRPLGQELGDASGDTTELALSEAYRALDKGDAPSARGLAQSVLLAAKANADQHSEARALACLAYCDRVTQRLRRASETSRRAAQVFERLGENAGESAALNTLAHSSMLLGRTDEALEAALLSVRLSEVQGASPAAVLAFNCLGLAYCWNGMFDKAAEALDHAIHLAARSKPTMSGYQPKLNQLFVEAMRLADERYQTSGMANVTRMGNLVWECRRLERYGEELQFMPGMLPTARTISVVMKLLCSAWQGEEKNARIYATRSVASLDGTLTWLDALVRWGLAELAWMQRDWAGTEAALMEMKSCAVSVEHEKLACLAHLLLVQVYELQGKTDLAILEGRALRSREHRIATESIASREAVVKWRMGARQSERQLEQALVASKQFERWSLEDALTGIANRRAFELALAERLPGAVADYRPLTVAMIDIDRFKVINDTYSHQVGDQVLKTVAALLTGSVRERDLPARLAGDEFVVLFNDADEAIAAEIVARIRHAIATFDWRSIAVGLGVSLSIGLSEAVAEDTVESIVHRSDKSMYEAKPRWEPTNI